MGCKNIKVPVIKEKDIESQENDIEQANENNYDEIVLTEVDQEKVESRMMSTYR